MRHVGKTVSDGLGLADVLGRTRTGSEGRRTRPGGRAWTGQTDGRLVIMYMAYRNEKSALKLRKCFILYLLLTRNISRFICDV
jgi:hypothetical protein